MSAHRKRQYYVHVSADGTTTEVDTVPARPVGVAYVSKPHTGKRRASRRAHRRKLKNRG